MTQRPRVHVSGLGPEKGADHNVGAYQGVDAISTWGAVPPLSSMADALGRTWVLLEMAHLECSSCHEHPWYAYGTGEEILCLTCCSKFCKTGQLPIKQTPAAAA